MFLDEATQKPGWIGEIKWSDRIATATGDVTRHMWVMLQNHPKIRDAFFTSKTITDRVVVNRMWINVIPTALYCYTVGRNVTTSLSRYGNSNLEETDFEAA